MPWEVRVPELYVDFVLWVSVSVRAFRCPLSELLRSTVTRSRTHYRLKNKSTVFPVPLNTSCGTTVNSPCDS